MLLFSISLAPQISYKYPVTKIRRTYWVNNIAAVNRIVWIKALWNGFLALILSFVLYMIPGLILGFKMGFELGSKMKDSGEMSARISETISRMYQENIVLMVGYIVITGLLILWRARVVSRGTVDRRLINGLLVGIVPAFLSLIFVFTRGISVISVIEIAAFIGMGILGGTLAVKTG
jgi:hypothetical protein